MNQPEPFEIMLAGGHSNSLGRTIEVVELVLQDRTKLDELYQCYFSQNEVVRLRVSNALKRICKEQPDWLVPYVDRFIAEISEIKQASAQWTLAQLFGQLRHKMTESQVKRATEVMKHNLININDWIVLNQTMATLFAWARTDEQLHAWLVPHLERLAKDSHGSVARRAKKYLIAI